MKKKKGIKEQYKLSWKYLKESRNFIYWIIGIFLFFSLVGFFLPVPYSIQQQIFDFIRELLEQTLGMSGSELVSFIFLNNLQSSFIGMIFGFVLGILPVTLAVANGYLIGFVSALSVQEAGILSLWRLLPHGIFELPAIFISLGLGLKCGTFIFKKNKAKTFRSFLWNSLRVFVFVVLPLLIIAAIMEGVLISLG